MSDITKSLFGNVAIKFSDAGDGTYTPVVATTVGAGATASNQATEISRLDTIIDRLPTATTPGLLPVNTISMPSVARSVTTSTSVASLALTGSCRRISMYATQGTWYAITGSASSSSHYIAGGERIDINVPANTTMSFLQESTAGAIRLTELV